MYHLYHFVNVQRLIGPHCSRCNRERIILHRLCFLRKTNVSLNKNIQICISIPRTEFILGINCQLIHIMFTKLNWMFLVYTIYHFRYIKNELQFLRKQKPLSLQLDYDCSFIINPIFLQVTQGID